MDVLGALRSPGLAAVVLAVALFFPVRRLIWVLSVRREEQRTGVAGDEARRQALRRRASVTAGLLCFVFAMLYAYTIVPRLWGG